MCLHESARLISLCALTSMQDHGTDCLTQTFCNFVYRMSLLKGNHNAFKTLYMQVLTGKSIGEEHRPGSWSCRRSIKWQWPHFREKKITGWWM